VHESSTSELRVGVLFSERTDLVDALTNLAASDPGIEVVAAVTDRRHATPATSPDVPVVDFAAAQYDDRVERDVAMADWLLGRGVQLVVCAGWLWLLSPEFLDRFPDRVLNVHPTLLPAFPGRHSVEAAVAYGVRVHGVTVHRVDTGIDTGPILAQSARPFPEPVDAGAVRAALAPIERQLLCEVVRTFVPTATPD
jgi:phosphoribosylglycinamide formyltransferase-1